MRAALQLFTALPRTSHPGNGGPPRPADAWAWAAVVGALVGVVWFVFHQLTVRGVGALVAGVVVVAIGAVVTGVRGHRGVAAVVRRLAEEGGGGTPDGPVLPAAGADVVAVTLVVVAQVSLLQRVTLVPAAIVVVPLVGRVVQAAVVRAEDRIGVAHPTAGQLVSVAVTGAAMLVLPVAMAWLERPVRLNPPIGGPGLVVLGLVATAAGLLVGVVAAGWLRARFEVLDLAGWHTVGMLGELAALVVVAVGVA